ncbi:hypothetical protein AAE478_007431 [Parahypoxylon ruwenzoriense]
MTGGVAAEAKPHRLPVLEQFDFMVSLRTCGLKNVMESRAVFLPDPLSRESSLRLSRTSDTTTRLVWFPAAGRGPSFSQTTTSRNLGSANILACAIPVRASGDSPFADDPGVESLTAGETFPCKLTGKYGDNLLVDHFQGLTAEEPLSFQSVRSSA